MCKTILPSLGNINRAMLDVQQKVQKSARKDRPVKWLRGFEKIKINPIATVTVSVPVATEDLAWYNPTTKQWVVDTMEYEVFIGSPSAEHDLLRSCFKIRE